MSTPTGDAAVLFVQRYATWAGFSISKIFRPRMKELFFMKRSFEI
jgi:hypothetical protein